MRTIAVISQKGGSGKTMLAVHLAVAAAATQDVAIIDLDPQKTATKWSGRRKAELPVVLSVHVSHLPKEIERVKGAGCQLLILDTPPHSGSAALEAAKFADIVLIPCRPAISDIETIAGTLNLIGTKTTSVYVVMNDVAPQGWEAKNATKVIAHLGVSVCSVQLGHRVAFPRSLIDGQNAQEFAPRDKASTEIKKLYAFVRTKLKTSVNK